MCFFTFKTTSLLTGASVYKCYANYGNALGQKKPGKVPENIVDMCVCVSIYISKTLGLCSQNVILKLSPMEQ